MSDIIIKAENLGKKYVIGHQAERGGYTALRDVLVQNARTLWSRTKDLAMGKPIIQGDTLEEVWALKDVNFEIKRGEAVGIIGRNGAGKSTLLKVLSRITEPTTGRVTIKGRVASLLEVGTGFHPELTGRENIYLNGTILGMTRVEIKQKFDEIVAFAEVEKYLDTPVKRYSSGMYVRLAFAVAAHLEPEILVVDEVLAVGDAAFQKKCLGKMGDVAQQGRTVLFVSHNMAAINKLCHKTILLNEGRLEILDQSETVISRYLQNGITAQGERSWAYNGTAFDERKFQLRVIRIKDYQEQEYPTASVDVRRSFYIEIEYDVLQAISIFRVAIKIIAADGTVVFTSSDSSSDDWEEMHRLPGRYLSRCEIPGSFLNEGAYSITISADIPFIEILTVEENALNFYVEQTGGVSGRYPERWPGVVCPQLKWNIESVPPA